MASLLFAMIYGSFAVIGLILGKSLKNRPGYGFFLGLVLGPFGWISICFSKKKINGQLFTRAQLKHLGGKGKRLSPTGFQDFQFGMQMIDVAEILKTKYKAKVFIQEHGVPDEQEVTDFSGLKGFLVSEFGFIGYDVKLVFHFTNEKLLGRIIVMNPKDDRSAGIYLFPLFERNLTLKYGSPVDIESSGHKTTRYWNFEDYNQIKLEHTVESEWHLDLAVIRYSWGRILHEEYQYLKSQASQF